MPCNQYLTCLVSQGGNSLARCQISLQARGRKLRIQWNFINTKSVNTTDQGYPRTYAISIQARGSNYGSSGFPCNQNNSGSSGAFVTCIYCGLSIKMNTDKIHHNAQRSFTMHKDQGRICFAFVSA